MSFFANDIVTSESESEIGVVVIVVELKEWWKMKTLETVLHETVMREKREWKRRRVVVTSLVWWRGVAIYINTEEKESEGELIVFLLSGREINEIKNVFALSKTLVYWYSRTHAPSIKNVFLVFSNTLIKLYYWNLIIVR